MLRISSSILSSKFLGFILVGVINTAVTYGLYLLLLVWLHYQVAYAIAYVTGIVLSYLLNATFVFSVSLSWRSFFSFPLVYLVQYAICLMAMYVLVEGFHLNLKLAPLIITAATIPITYILSKWVLIKRNKQ